jgi:hypothetical protein
MVFSSTNPIWASNLSLEIFVNLVSISPCYSNCSKFNPLLYNIAASQIKIEAMGAFNMEGVG